MVEKDYMLYGTKILNLKTQEIGLLICLWENKFTDITVDFATCVDKTGKRYNIELDNIRGFEDDFEKEKQVFFMEFRKAYVKIVKQYMYIDSV